MIPRMKFFSVALRFLFCVLSVCSSSALLLSQAWASPSSVYITVRDAKLRGKPDFFSPTVGDLKYGDRLEVLGEQGSWFQVKNATGRQGYIHSSAISERKVVLKSSATFSPGGADQSDVVLAGKGFSADVERQFASAHSNLNFAEVDAMERNKVSPKDLLAFAAQGHLGSQGGAR